MYHGQLLIIAENTGVLTKQEYDEFINELVKEDKNGTYLYSKPYYIYKGIKKIVLKTGSTFIYVKVEPQFSIAQLWNSMIILIINRPVDTFSFYFIC